MAVVTRVFRTAKVPEITVAFWVIKVLTTAMGEATSEFFVQSFNPELAVIGAGVVFLCVLVWQLRQDRYRTIPYWSTVVMVSVFGTMCADVVHVGLGVPYTVSVVGFSVALVVVFVTWYRSERTLSIHSINTSKRELFYWTTVTVTFALGTAVGDFTATTAKLGYFGSGVLFCVLISIPAIINAVWGVAPIATFWAAYILTRPLGASFADWMGVSHARGGLNWGPGNVALALSAAIVVAVWLLARSERRGRIN